MAGVLVVAALTVGVVGVEGGQVASGQTDPIGYSVGLEAETGGPADCNFYAINLVTGAAEVRNDTPVACADGLTFSADGTLYAVQNNAIDGDVETNLVTIDVATGAQTVIGPLPTSFTGASGMTFDAAGNLWLYASSLVSDGCTSVDFQWCLWQVDPTDASTTAVGVPDEGEALGVYGLTASCDGGVIGIVSTIAAGVDSGISLQSVDTATAALNPIVDVPTVASPQGLDYDSAGGLWAISGVESMGFFNDIVVQNIDPTTGTSTTIPVTVGGEPFRGFMAGLGISPIDCPVPPPAPDVVVVQPTFTG